MNPTGSSPFARLVTSFMMLCMVGLGIASPRSAETEGTVAASPADGAGGRYEFKKEHDRDGLGKFYLGREIAHYMSHQGAPWLDRPEREEEEKTTLMVDSLGLKPGDVVADIGAGTGYITERLARKVGAKGKVYAEEIQPEMLTLLREKMTKLGLKNVEMVLGTINDPKLPPASIDLAIMVDVYHEFSEPYEMLVAIKAALKPGGRIAFVEFRGEDPAVPIKLLHKMTEAQVRKEAEAAGFVWEKTVGTLPWQHLILVRKPAAPGK